MRGRKGSDLSGTQQILKKLSYVATFIFDVDGTLTDGGLWVTPDGNLIRRMDIRDGYAINYALRKGYQIIVISGARMEGVRERLKRLGVTHIYSRISDKLDFYKWLEKKLNLYNKAVLYMGDDIPDVPLLQYVGFGCCPSNAAPEVLNVVDWITYSKGGYGAAREVIEKVLRLHGRWNDVTSTLW